MYKFIYRLNKNNFIVLQNNESLLGGCGTKHNDHELIMKRLIELANSDIKNIKLINFHDLCGLDMRVYEREGKNIQNITFIPPNVLSYLDKITDPNTLDEYYIDYYKEQYGNILNNNLCKVELNFNTNKSIVKVAFADNYRKNNNNVFTINLPIKLVDFIEKTFDHFDKVGLVGYPDNGGIDGITYDSKKEVYLVKTWS
jgi:hypothetical protein